MYKERGTSREEVKGLVKGEAVWCLTEPLGIRGSLRTRLGSGDFLHLAGHCIHREQDINGPSHRSHPRRATGVTRQILGRGVLSVMCQKT